MNYKRLVPIIVILAELGFIGGVVAISYTSITVNNSGTITKGTAIGIADFTVGPVACPALGSTSYTVTSPFQNTITWGVTAGGSQTQWFCIENQGSGSDNLPTITMSNIQGFTCSVADVSCLTLTISPNPIPTLASQAVSGPISVTVAAKPDATGSGTFDLVVT